MAVPTEVEAEFDTCTEQVEGIDAVGGDGAVVVNLGHVVLVDGEQDVVGVGSVVEAGEAIAAIDAEVEAPVVAKGNVEAQVCEEADTPLGHLLNLAFGTVVVDAEAVVGQVTVGDVGGGGVALGLVGTVDNLVPGADGHVVLGTKAEQEGPLLAHWGAEVQLNRDAQHTEVLGFEQVVVGVDGIILPVVAGVSDKLAALDRAVVLGDGGVEAILSSDAETEVLAKEVHILELTKESVAGEESAVGGVIHQAVEACTEVVSDIVAVLIALCLHTGGEERGDNQDEYTFHFLLLFIHYFLITRTVMPSTVTV